MQVTALFAFNFVFITNKNGHTMIWCNERCQLFFRCNCSGLGEQCVFDMGLAEDDSDDFLERTTY